MVMSNRRPFDVRLYDEITPGERPMGYLCLLSDQSEVGNILNRIRINEWLTNLVPSRALRQWCNGIMFRTMWDLSTKNGSRLVSR